jgi:hypothetical protein
MTITRQFLVTLPGWFPGADPDLCANSLRMALEMTLSDPRVSPLAVRVSALRMIGDDDSDLQMAFRRLSAATQDPNLHSTSVTQRQARAIVNEMVRPRPERTSQVDHAALQAVLAIRDADQQPGQQVQKNARAQLIITDAICRCVPEDKA